MTKVFLLEHTARIGEDEDVKFIGVYATENDAKAAIERLKTKPGFRDQSGAFNYSDYEINSDHWTEGYGIE
jgi:homoserine kinase type II